MSCSTQVPKDHPLMIAWEAHKASEAYANSLHWARHVVISNRKSDDQLSIDQPHVEGSLWALFMAGWQAREAAVAPVISKRPTVEELEQILVDPRDAGVLPLQAVHTRLAVD